MCASPETGYKGRQCKDRHSIHANCLFEMNRHASDGSILFIIIRTPKQNMIEMPIQCTKYTVISTTV